MWMVNDTCWREERCWRGKKMEYWDVGNKILRMLSRSERCSVSRETEKTRFCLSDIAITYHLPGTQTLVVVCRLESPDSPEESEFACNNFFPFLCRAKKRKETTYSLSMSRQRVSSLRRTEAEVDSCDLDGCFVKVCIQILVSPLFIQSTLRILNS